MKISKHISIEEAIKSQTAIRYGINNYPNDEELANMVLVAQHCFEPLREWYGKPIGISSFFRCKELNRRIGSKDTSQHLAGSVSGLNESAMDIDADIYNNGITNKQIFEWLRDNVEFDQLIWEYGTDDEPAWVHVSYRLNGNRKQVLRIK